MEKMEVDNKDETDYDVVEEEITDEGDGFDISEKTLRHTIHDVHKLTVGQTSSSKPEMIRGLPWRILVMPRPGQENKKQYLGFFLQCNSESNSNSWTCTGSATLRVIPCDDSVEQQVRKISHSFHSKENDWGYSQFLTWEDATDPARGYCSPSHQLVLEAEVFADAPHGIQWDSKKHTGYVGLKNQGATCYMNSLLQTLFFTNKLRRAVYQMPTELEDQSVPLALQRVFHELQHSDKPVGTKKLTKSFGWESLDSFMQHDVQELCRVLLDNLESKMKGTSVVGTINWLLEGKTISYIKCKNVDYKSEREESFYDIQLSVKNNATIIDSFDEYIKPDLLEGDNKFDAGEYGFQDAEKGVLFKTFPPVLHLQLMRFQYDPITDSNVKINDKCEFTEEIDLDSFLERPDPERPAKYILHAVLVHSGDNYGGHYVAYINPKGDGKWYKFDDDVVSSCSKKEAIYSNYGGSNEDNGFIKSCTNAYMLVYIRKDEVNEILCQVTPDKIPQTLTQRFTEEKEIDSIKKKEKQEAHLYLSVTVITDEQFNGHQGSGLLDPDNVAYRTVKVKKSLSWSKLNSRISEYFGLPDGTFQIWIFKRKHDPDVWRPEPLEEEDTTDREIKDFQQVDPTNFAVWLEIAPHGGHVEKFNTKDDLLVFLRLYEPETESLCYCGHVTIPCKAKLSELIPVMNKRARWSSEVKSVQMWEDKAQGDCRNLDDLEKPLDEALSELQDGVVIIFQKNSMLYNPRPRLRNVSEYFRDQANRQEVIFVNRETNEMFKVLLNQRQSYKELAAEAGAVLNRDPRLIQFFKQGPFNRDQPGQPIKSTETRNIEEILYVASQNARDTRRPTKRIYYQHIDIPIEDFESKKTIPIKFIHADLSEEDIIVHINKNSIVADLLKVVKEKMIHTIQDALFHKRKLRLIEYVTSRIITIRQESESLAESTATNKNFRVEAVPDDQLEFNTGEVLIQVCHFTSVIQSTFGIPFLLKLKDQEKIINVRHRIQKTLDINDKDFAKWKMALVQNNQPKYYSELNDHEQVVTSQFYAPTRDGVPLVQNRVWIGLDHPNRQKRNPLKPVYTEKPIKIHN